MVKIVEYENVYLEYPDEEELTDDSKEVKKSKKEDLEQEDFEKTRKSVKEGKTARLSLEELQQKLEETQTLHL